MKKNYIFLLFAIFLGGAFAKAQTTLSPGDLVVISLEADSPDTFRFVPLVDLAAGTEIFFSESGYNDATMMLNTNESILKYTVPATITAGTNVYYNTSDPGFVAADWTFEQGTSTGIAASGDQMIVFQGSISSPTFIFAAQSNSTVWQSGGVTDSNQSALPAGLTDGTNAVAAGSGPGPEDEFDNIYYTGTTSGTKAVLLAAVADATNWSGNNSKDPMSEITTDFTVQAGTSNPSVTITSPADNTVVSSTSSVDVQLSVTNFDFNTDGDLAFTVTNNGTPVTIIKMDASTETVAVTPGETYTVSAQLRDTAMNNLTNSEASSSVTFTVEFPCDLTLDMGSIATTCDTSTSGIDTYSASIDFTGGNTGVTYSLNVPMGVTVGGDDPNTDAAGTITLQNMNEGDDTLLTIAGGTGSSCNLTVTFFSPSCLSLPITEQFDYTVGDMLTQQTNWGAAGSNPVLVGNGSLSVSGLAPSAGNHVIIASTSGEDPILEFTPVTSGTVYASFIFQVTGFPTTTGTVDTTDGGYFAILASDTFSFESRLWVRPIENMTSMMIDSYDIGLSEGSAPVTNFTSTTYNLGDTVFAVIAYDLDNQETRLYLNPASSTFGSAPPASATITAPGDMMNPVTQINSFRLRQDSDRETSTTLVDELRLGTSYADVTPTSTATVGSSSIAGFELYPNPVSTGIVNIRTLDANSKSVVVYDILGKQVVSTSYEGTAQQINVSALKSGIYILKLTDGANTVSRKLIIK